MERIKRTRVRVVSITAEASIPGRALKAPGGPTESSKKTNLMRELIARKSAKAAIIACVVIP